MRLRFLMTSLLASGVLCIAAPSSATVFNSDPVVTAQKQKPTDDQIDERVEFRLETSDVVRKYNIHCKVAAGVVMLSGDVATAAQKTEAERLAKGVDGVVKVENGITVEPNADKTVTDRIKSGMNKTGEAITDSWITTKVKWFLAKDEGLGTTTSIDVTTKDHIVTLKGTVKSAADKTRAVELANKTDGVKRVVDELTIKAGTK
jgi:osmotically-inducible protein OsmY